MVQVPMLDGPAIPTALVIRCTREAADGVLTSLLVTIEKVDRERYALGKDVHEAGALGVVSVPDGTRPVPRTANR